MMSLPTNLHDTDDYAIAGISGGRTSALMAEMLGKRVTFAFQNTGREAAKTIDFIERVEQDLQHEIVRMEFRAPARGEPPRMSTFEVVDHRHLSRKGEPFRDLLDCMRTYRHKHKGKGPVAPWARQRMCTAYLKIRTQRKYCRALGWGEPTDYVEYVGLRADEPLRVARLRQRNQDRNTDERAPLAELGITKAEVLAHWATKPFDLGLPEHMGNCTGCFLKDERDLASALLEDETDAAWWIDIEERYAPMRRGRSSYRQILAEAPARMQIRQALQRGDVLIPAVDLPQRRFKLIVAQELSAPTSFSCECDAAKADDDDDFDEAA